MRLRRLLILAALLPVGVAGAEPDLPRHRPLTDRTFAPTTERLERGRYLAEHLLQCFICHSERDWTRPGAPPIATRKGAGAIYSQQDDRIVVAPNITPDVETGAGAWTDDMLARAIREGIGHDGRALYPAMWYQSFAALSDEDLAAVIVYLRSIPAVRNALPATRLLPDELAGVAAAPKPITDPVAGPQPGDRLARGKYLISVADCVGCHTSWYSPRNPGLLAGGNHIPRGTHAAYSTNITRHESGTGYPTETFVAVMRSGKGESMSGVMPWAAFKGLSDEDLGAIHEALGLLQPVAHYIGNVGVPRHCAVCGQEHPLGELNRLVTPVERLAGQYHSSEFDVTLEIRHDRGKLYGREGEGPEIELVPQSATRFLAPGWPTPVEFVLGADGRSTRLAMLELEPVYFERIR
jgi:mono/diheme cytochrome c family protein